MDGFGAANKLVIGAYLSNGRVPNKCAALFTDHVAFN